MCEKCVELDSKIEHYQHMASRITDQATLDGIQQLIERMQAQKAAFTPNKSSKAASVGRWCRQHANRCRLLASRRAEGPAQARNADIAKYVPPFGFLCTRPSSHDLVDR
jgi:hypothetical protein